jgi:hypothetical protein
VSKPVANSIERDKHVLRLLELQFKYSQRIDELANVGVDLGKLVIDLNLLHLALDMLGVPADTSLKYFGWDHEPNASPPDDLFCRDAFSAEFERIVPDGTLPQYLEYMKVVGTWVKQLEHQ